MISITKGKLLELNAALESLKRIYNTKFAYAVGQNRKKIANEIEVITDSGKMSPRFTEYEEKRFGLVKKMAKYDDKGQMVMLPDRTISIPDLKGFESYLNPIREEYKEAIAEREKQIKDFEEQLKEKWEFEPFLINWKYVPDDLRADEMEQIIDLLTGLPDDMPVKEKKDKCQEPGH